MTDFHSPLHRLASLFVDIGGRLHDASSVDDALSLISASAVEVCPGAEYASVSLCDGRANNHRDSQSDSRSGNPSNRAGFRTVGATGDIPLQVDAIQYELRSGPCVDAVLEHTMFRSDDLAHERRWPEFSQRVVAETGVLSMLAFRMFFESSTLIAGLNLYATRAGAFDDDDESSILLLSTHGAQALAGISWQNEAQTLERALSSNRDIGVAMGILMARYLLTRDEAFGVLRMASQHRHRKLAAIALEVIETGDLELPGRDSAARIASNVARG